MAEKIILYHYTTRAGKDGIRESGVINESIKTGARDDARYGNGVYLTALPPSSGKIRLALNNYDGSEKHAKKYINWGRVNCYVKVELNAKDAKHIVDERDIYMYPGDLVLDDAIAVTFGDVVRG